jgi:hypothetical protein
MQGLPTRAAPCNRAFVTGGTKDRRRISAPPAKSVWGNRSAQEKTSALRESEPSAHAGQIRDEIQKLVAEIATLLV